MGSESVLLQGAGRPVDYRPHSWERGEGEQGEEEGDGEGKGERGEGEQGEEEGDGEGKGEVGVNGGGFRGREDEREGRREEGRMEGGHTEHRESVND